MEAILAKVLVVLAVVLVLVVLTFVAVVWSKYAALPLAGKVGVVGLVVVVLLLVALLFGWVAAAELEAKGVPTSFNSLTTKATIIWLAFDRWTRENPWMGVAMLCSLPLLFWPPREIDDEESSNECSR